MTEQRARLTDAELVERLKLYEQHGSNVSKAARALGIGRPAMSTSLSEARRRGLTAHTKTVDAEARLRTKLSIAERELASVFRHNLDAETVRKEIYDLAAITPSPPQWVVKKTKPGLPGVPMTVWSDWHWGERISRVEVGGVNEFNRAIGWERVRTLVEKTIDLAHRHMVNPKYPGIVVCLGGDMITGAIHEELGETNDGTVQQACLDVQEALIWGLEQIADVFGRVFVPCVVGNHSRDCRKPRAKQAVYRSFEWNIYCQLERHFRGDRRIHFMVPSEPDCLFTVAGHRYFLTHGDRLGVKGGDGMIGALGPITRGAIKVGRQQAQIGRDFDTLILCHYHTFIPRSEASAVIVNGCLCGFNEYANLGLRVPYSRPSQALWFSHPEWGVTFQLAIYLEKQQASLRGPSDWVTWQNIERGWNGPETQAPKARRRPTKTPRSNRTRSTRTNPKPTRKKAGRGRKGRAA